MPMFRKKPVEIEARQWDGTTESTTAILSWIEENGGFADYWTRQPDRPLVPSDLIRIKTLEGSMTASAGDWIIKGVEGEFYPCKPRIFEATYEQVQP